MKNSEYWQERFRQLEAAQNRLAQTSFKEIEAQYRAAQKELEGKINTWYQRLAKNNNISMAEARKLLSANELEEFKWSVWDYIKHGEENALDGQWIKQLENASAKFHISKYQALMIDTRQSFEQMFGKQLGTVTDTMGKVFENGYYKTAYELQKGMGIGFDVGKINREEVENVLSKPWAADGKNFSERIWGNKEKLINEVHTQLTQNIITGADPQKAIDTIAKKMNTSKSNAGRLVMTEEAYFSSAAQEKSYKDLGVEQYEVLATLDSHTSEICQNLDGKVFDMKDYKAGVTAPPFHVRCRSTTVPHLDEELWGDSKGERAARDKDGKTYYVPDDITYPQWKETFVDGDKSGFEVVDKSENDDIIKKKLEIKELSKLKQSGMSETEYLEYLNTINNHSNENVIRLYSEYADDINSVTLTVNGGAYQPASATLKFTYPQYADMNKYGTLAHEYGHFFDDKAKFDGLHFNEVEAVKKATGLDTTFKSVASSSDEFLAAIRDDKIHIKSILTKEAKADLIAHNASHGVQDAIDGLFAKSRLRWGHGEKYYNRKYSSVESMDKTIGGTRKKDLQQVYKDFGLDASNQAKTKLICRQYEAASEAWANIMSAEVCGGESLEYVKKYLPNSYKTMLEILKGVKVNE